jgi:hypothetical protein
MQKKIVEIMTCAECPHCFPQEVSDDFVCTISGNNEVKNIAKIASWCPLPDFLLTGQPVN